MSWSWRRGLVRLPVGLPSRSGTRKSGLMFNSILIAFYNQRFFFHPLRRFASVSSCPGPETWELLEGTKASRVFLLWTRPGSQRPPRTPASWSCKQLMLSRSRSCPSWGTARRRIQPPGPGPRRCRSSGSSVPRRCPRTSWRRCHSRNWGPLQHPSPPQRPLGCGLKTSEVLQKVNFLSFSQQESPLRCFLMEMCRFDLE